MRVLLVGPDYEENLSLRYLVSSLRAAGHQADIAAFDTQNDANSVVEAAAWADAVGLSMCYQVRAKEFLGLARALKRARPEQRVFAGGHYASCAADDLLARHPELDVIAVHECEQTIVELASLAEWTESTLGTVAGLVFRGQGRILRTKPRQALAELDRLPWPDRSGPARLMAGVPTAYMMGSRGCLGACDYCCITTMHRMVEGKRFRQRSPRDIAGEMASLYHDRGVRQFIFHDDNFLVPRIEHNLERIDALDRAMREKRLRHIALALKCRPGDVNREVFLRLREMGLLRVFLGIESGSRAGLASIGRRQSVEEEHRALRLCEDLGMSTQYTIILFHPEATLQSMREDLEFVSAHLGHPLSFCRAEIYAGTPLEQRMVRVGRAYGDYLARAYRYTDTLTGHAWDAVWSLLFARCFAPEHLLGQIVRLDHQAVVLRRFYDGRAVDALVDDFMVFEREVNRDTVAVMREILDLCEAYPDPRSEAFVRVARRLAEREQSRCEFLLRRACAFRDAIREQSLGRMGLVRGRASAAGEGKNFIDRLPRHAAAVFLAVGLMNCDQKSSLESGHGDGSLSDSNLAADSNTASDASDFKDQGGMFEAPPPRLDAPLSTDAVDDAASLAGDASNSADASSAIDGAGIADAVVFRDQGGMLEAPPPPLDAPTSNLDAFVKRD